MAAYVIVFREGPITDIESLATYHRKARQVKGDFKITPLAFDGRVVGLEGKEPEGVVVLEFPTIEDAKAWYNDPDYQEALGYRLKAAEHRGFIVEGL